MISSETSIGGVNFKCFSSATTSKKTAGNRGFVKTQRRWYDTTCWTKWPGRGTETRRPSAAAPVVRVWLRGQGPRSGPFRSNGQGGGPSAEHNVSIPLAGCKRIVKRLAGVRPAYVHVNYLTSVFGQVKNRWTDSAQRNRLRLPFQSKGTLRRPCEVLPASVLP